MLHHLRSKSAFIFLHFLCYFYKRKCFALLGNIKVIIYSYLVALLCKAIMQCYEQLCCII